MNALIYVVTVTGKVSVYRDHTLAAALQQFFLTMDPSMVKEIALYHKFVVDPVDSKIYKLLEDKGLSSALK